MDTSQTALMHVKLPWDPKGPAPCNVLQAVVLKLMPHCQDLCLSALNTNAKQPFQVPQVGKIYHILSCSL